MIVIINLYYTLTVIHLREQRVYACVQIFFYNAFRVIIACLEPLIDSSGICNSCRNLLVFLSRHAQSIDSTLKRLNLILYFTNLRSDFKKKISLSSKYSIILFIIALILTNINIALNRSAQFSKVGAFVVQLICILSDSNIISSDGFSEVFHLSFITLAVTLKLSNCSTDMLRRQQALLKPNVINCTLIHRQISTADTFSALQNMFNRIEMHFRDTFTILLCISNHAIYFRIKRCGKELICISGKITNNLLLNISLILLQKFYIAFYSCLFFLSCFCISICKNQCS